jgi:hypothetical protein
MFRFSRPGTRTGASGDGASTGGASAQSGQRVGYLVGVLGRDAQHGQDQLRQVRGGRVAVEVGAGEPQLHQGQRSPAQRGQGDDRLYGGGSGRRRGRPADHAVPAGTGRCRSEGGRGPRRRRTCMSSGWEPAMRALSRKPAATSPAGSSMPVRRSSKVWPNSFGAFVTAAWNSSVLNSKWPHRTAPSSTRSGGGRSRRRHPRARRSPGCRRRCPGLGEDLVGGAKERPCGARRGVARTGCRARASAEQSSAVRRRASMLRSHVCGTAGYGSGRPHRLSPGSPATTTGPGGSHRPRTAWRLIAEPLALRDVVRASGPPPAGCHILRRSNPRTPIHLPLISEAFTSRARPCRLARPRPA